MLQNEFYHLSFLQYVHTVVVFQDLAISEDTRIKIEYLHQFQTQRIMNSHLFVMH